MLDITAPYSLAECQTRLLQLHQKTGFALTALHVRTDVRLTPRPDASVEVTIKRIRRDLPFTFAPWATFVGQLEAAGEHTTRLTGDAHLGWQIPLFWNVIILGSALLTIGILAMESTEGILPAFLFILVLLAVFNTLFGAFEVYQKRQLLQLLYETFKEQPLGMTGEM